MYKVRLDEDDYFTGNYAVIGDIKDSMEVEKLPDETDPVKLICYKLIDGEWVYDEERYQELVAKQEEIKTQIAEQKDTEVSDDLLQLAVEHEYRITLLELEV